MKAGYTSVTIKEFGSDGCKMHLKSAIPNIYNMHRKKELRTNAHIMTPSFLHHVKERREETQKGRRENRGGVKHHAIKYVKRYGFFDETWWR